MLEVEVEDKAVLDTVARVVAYGAWAVVGETSKPAVKVAWSAEATVALRSAWEVIP